MRKNTFVISAFPGCGKSYCYKNYQDKFTILDSDSSNFSWVKDSEGNNTKERDPNFPQNYIEHIKDNIGKVDFIFVSSHAEVRKALIENNIKVILVYPDKSLKNEFIKRYKERGNDESFIKFIDSNWDKFIDDIENDNQYSNITLDKLSKTNLYITLDNLYFLTDNSMGNLSSLWAN